MSRRPGTGRSGKVSIAFIGCGVMANSVHYPSLTPRPARPAALSPAVSPWQIRRWPAMPDIAAHRLE
jgi:hypothetical protein